VEEEESHIAGLRVPVNVDVVRERLPRLGELPVEREVTPEESIDAVALIETVGSGDVVYSDTIVGPDGSFVPAHVYRCDEWLIGGFTLGTNDSPGTENPCEAEVEFRACGAEFTPIYEIQGSGDTTPLLGDQVVTEGVVVGDFQEGDELKGFYLQDPDGDGDAATSDGIFVYYGFWNGQVSIGDHVRVLGTATEFFGLTEITDVTQLEICGTGTVTPTIVTLPVTDTGDFEAYEGMLVTFPQTLVISEFYNFDRFGEIVLTTERQFQATTIAEPGSTEADTIKLANQLARITRDDGSSDPNPDPARHPTGDPFTLDNRFRGGDTVTNVTGVMDYAFGKYKIQPTTGANFTVANPRPAVPYVGGTVTVASCHVLNFGTHLDDRVTECGPPTPTLSASRHARSGHRVFAPRSLDFARAMPGLRSR
jgi:predicted extracellular nuclease